MTFRVILYLLYFRMGLVSQQRSYMMQFPSFRAALRYYWIIPIIIGKWTKPKRSLLEMTFRIIQSNSSLDSWSISSPRSCIQENKEKGIGPFVRQFPKNSKIWPFSDLWEIERWPLERFNQTRLLAVHWYPPWQAICLNRNNLPNCVWSICRQVNNEPILTFLTFKTDI